MTDASTDRRDVFVSRFNRILAVVVWAGAAAALASAPFLPGGAAWSTAATATFAALFAWCALWRPRVAVDDDGIELVNVTHTVRVPWAALIQLDTRFALTLVTPRRRYSAWAAPAPGRLAAARAGRRERRGPNARDGVRPGDLPATDSGDAAMLVRDRWDELLAADRIEIGVAEHTPVSVRVHVVSIALLVLSAAAALLLLALG